MIINPIFFRFFLKYPLFGHKVILQYEIFIVVFCLAMPGEIMTEYQGFCLKCKTYGLIKDHQLHTMTNGRVRAAGTCSQEGCTGKISKIIS